MYTTLLIYYVCFAIATGIVSYYYHLKPVVKYILSLERYQEYYPEKTKILFNHPVLSFVVYVSTITVLAPLVVPAVLFDRFDNSFRKGLAKGFLDKD